MKRNVQGMGEIDSAVCEENIWRQNYLWIIKSGFGNEHSRMFFNCVSKILIFFLVIFLLTGCFDKEECPAYPTEYLKWMPYKKGQTLTFTDENNVFQLKVDQFEVSKKLRVYKDLSGLYHCTPYAQSDISSSGMYPKINLWSSWGCVDCTTTANMSSIIHFNFTVWEIDDGGYSFGFAFEKDNLFIDNVYYPSWSHTKYEILNKHHNGFKEYSRVICVEIDTLIPVDHMSSDIYKLYVAESVGIIEYVRKKGNQSVCLKED